MTPIRFSIERNLAEVYDSVFDSLGHNEDALAHASVRALLQYIESSDDGRKEEINELMAKHRETALQNESDEVFEREILIDPITLSWLERMNTQYDSDNTWSVFMTGVLVLWSMLDILKRDPEACLTITAPSNSRSMSVEVPFSQIVYGRPQSQH